MLYCYIKLTNYSKLYAKEHLVYMHLTQNDKYKVAL